MHYCFQSSRECCVSVWVPVQLLLTAKILQDNGHVCSDKSGKKYLYYAALTKQEHITCWLQKLCKDSFGNSLGNLLTAFSGGKKLDSKDADDLRAYLEKYEK
ncbi:MAG: BlaI/MecI/CopY family transcriptional regulator [Lachnospiraceae bacterium]|nr:BlaI/MecI/CopY family transcriptional regulator [Lachnospiraceae bacterium]